MMRADPTVTIVIPTFNGERLLNELLLNIRRQVFEGVWEVLVIDSGSTDATLDIIRDFPEVQLLQIPNSEFGHGRTRNLGAERARGEFVAFLTQDAVPAHPYWLKALVEPFTISPRVQAVFGKQTPRPIAPPLIKYEIQRVFAQFCHDSSIALFFDTPYLDGRYADYLHFYSDVNSATRRDFIVNVVPLRDVQYAEDLCFAEDALAAGFIKAYAPMAEVIHSNDLRFDEIRGRAFDETQALINMGRLECDPHYKLSLRMLARRSFRDARSIVRDASISWKRKLLNLCLNPLMLHQQQLGQRDAHRFLSRGRTGQTLSLEESRRSLVEDSEENSN